MAQKITFDAQQQAIMITRFDSGCDDLLGYANKLLKTVETLDGYESKHKAQLIEKIEEVKSAIKKSIAVVEDEKNIVKKKRDFLIENEATNPFAGIEVERPKTTIPVQ